MAVYNLFPGAPQLGTADDNTAVNLGTEFYVTGPAWVTQLRYLQPATVGAYDISTQSRTAGLYSVNTDGLTGTLVAGPVTIPAPAPGQWGGGNLAVPFKLTPGTRYRVVVHHPDGRYAATGAYFTGPDYTYGPVVVPDSVDAYSNLQGSYNYGPALTFPASSFNSASYYSDVTVTDQDPAASSGTADVTVAVSMAARPWDGDLSAPTARTGALPSSSWKGTLP